ncbi:MAG: SDR family NAD(P)-dependent oxidoreductase [Actinobacteria bacterium]|nr:MAG: SDR family NAD(P)-dependent oxidoreductase [Actinomycetota bacterium]
MIDSWTGKRALVTGASSGIGAAVAKELARAGAIVGICARRTEMLEAVLDDCRRTVPECRAWTIDLADLDALEGFASQVEDELGGIDVLVNNAGVALCGAATTLPWTDVEYLLRIDFLSPVRLTRAVLPSMQARGQGDVVVVSSMAARMATPGEAAYAAAKAALSAYFEALAGELWDSGVRFHLVYPALIDLTPGVDGDDELAVTSDGRVRIPAPVQAREIRRQLEQDEFELYTPRTMHDLIANRARDVAASVEFMGNWYRAGAHHA